MKKENTEQEILKALKAGAYRNHYLLYNRKSTDESESQKNSIEFQKKENIRFAKSNGFKIADLTLSGFCSKGIIAERHSGFKEGEELHITEDGEVRFRIDRPKFQRLVQYVNQGYVKGIVCLCWDRISRNKADDTVIRKLMKRGSDIRFVYAQYDDSSAGELHMDIDGMFAQHHSRVTSEKVRLSMRNSRSKGKCTYGAPIGYLNEGNMDHKPFDPERAESVRELFDLYATGDWSLSDLTRHAKKIGLTAVPRRKVRTKEEILSDTDIKHEKVTKPIAKGGMARILRNQFYIGKVVGVDGEYVDSISHEPLVDVRTFNRVQELLTKSNVSIHYTDKMDHPLRGLVRCAHCNRIYTPYEKKGHLYFYCRCVAGCKNTQKSIRLEYITDRLRGLMSSLHLTEAELEELNSHVSTDIALLEHKRLQASERVDRRKKTIREELAYLRANRLQLLKAGVYSPEDMVSEHTRLESELDALQEQETVSEQAMRDLMDEVATLSELIKTVIPTYDIATPHEKEKIIRIVFSELKIAHDTLEYKVEKGFKAFDNRFDDFCAPNLSFSELCKQRDDIQKAIASLRNLI